MSLEPKTFKVNNIETKDYDDVHFIPAIVDGKEVYEVKNSSNGSFNLFVPEGAKVAMKNSLFNNAEMSFIGTSKVNIADAEVSGKLEALALSNIEGSVLSNVSLCEITSVENSFLEDFSTANTPFSRIRDYNSNSKEEPKNDLASPMTTRDFEAL